MAPVTRTVTDEGDIVIFFVVGLGLDLVPVTKRIKISIGVVSRKADVVVRILAARVYPGYLYCSVGREMLALNIDIAKTSHAIEPRI